MNRILIFETIALTILVVILYSLGLYYSLYWVTGWYDIVMHFLGGLWVAFFVMYLVFVVGIVKLPRHDKVIISLITIGSVIIVGMAWELWELFSGLSFVFKDTGDTILDLIMDIVGGSFGLLYGIKILCKKN